LPGRIRNRYEINAAMLKKPFIFGVQKGINKVPWDLLKGDRDQALAIFLYQLAVSTQNFKGGFQVHFGEG